MKPSVHSFDLYETLISKRDGRDEDVFYIEETMAKIKPEDVIISDMYLSKERLRELSGLSNRMFLSNRGKLDGTVWPEAQKEYDIIDHTGDNLFSDVTSPQAYNIPGILCTLSNYTGWELEISKVLPNLAKAIREARLSTWHPDPMMRRRQLCQIEANFPIMFLASLLLDKRLTNEQVLMCSRDCYLWAKILDLVKSRLKSKYSVKYFYISRLCQYHPTSAYLRYVNDLLPNAVIVDLGGTGRSTTNLLKHTEQPNTPIIFFLRYKCAEGTEFESSNIQSLITDVAEVDLERANTAPHAMMGIGGQFPSAQSLAWMMDEATIQHYAFEVALNATRRYPMDIDINEFQLRESIYQCCLRLKEYDDCQEYANKRKSDEELEITKVIESQHEKST